MKQTALRFFAAGLLFSAAMLYVYTHYFIEKEKPQLETAQPAELSMTEVDRFLNEKGLIAVDKATWEAAQAPTSEKDVKSNENNDNQEDNSKNQQEQELRYILEVTPGMTSNEIADRLEKAEIITSAADFKAYMKEHQLDRKIQIGAYSISNTTPLTEIAKTITK